MKLVYIGTSDELSEVFIERMNQEGHDVYFLSDEKPARKSKGAFKYRFYRFPRRDKDFESLLHSISPDCIVFAGSHYFGKATDEEIDKDITRLAQSLRAAVTKQRARFILLSSTDVYGYFIDATNEESNRVPITDRGIRFVREEDLVEIYSQNYGLDATIIRATDLFAPRAREANGDMLSQAFDLAHNTKPEVGPLDNVYYKPLHVSDLVDAINRVINGGDQHIYNVGGKKTISARQLYQIVCKHEDLPERGINWRNVGDGGTVDSDRIRQELSWNDIRDLESDLSSGRISYETLSNDKGAEEKKGLVPKPVRQFIENVLIFAVFFAISFFTTSNALFPQFDWMMIYVVLIAIAYSMYQSAFAAILASGAYFYLNHIEFIRYNTFYAYADNLLVITQYLFIGLIISYTCSTLRENVKNSREDYEIVKEDFDDLKVINSENVLIKNEYEKRLLSANNGLPKLYDLMKRLMVQEPGRILMETMEVISELIGTDNVAVYQGQGDSPWYRLIGALNPESAMEGKTWNISDNPRIYKAVQDGELFRGALGTDEPAVVLPINCGDGLRAIVLIKSLPYESESLYNINMLKTLALLLRDSMQKALQNEELTRDEHYIKDTNILRPTAFREQIMLAQEKSDKNLADFSILELECKGSVKKTARAIANTLRATDHMGINEDERLFILLNNTDLGSIAPIQQRLLENGVQSHPVAIEYKVD